MENYWGAILYSFLAVWRMGDAFILKASFFIGLLRMCFLCVDRVSWMQRFYFISRSAKKSEFLKTFFYRGKFYIKVCRMGRLLYKSSLKWNSFVWKCTNVRSLQEERMLIFYRQAW